MTNSLARVTLPPDLMERLEECAAHAQGMGPNELILPDEPTYKEIITLLNSCPTSINMKRFGSIWIDLKTMQAIQGRIPLRRGEGR